MKRKKTSKRRSLVSKSSTEAPLKGQTNSAENEENNDRLLNTGVSLTPMLTIFWKKCRMIQGGTRRLQLLQTAQFLKRALCDVEWIQPLITCLWHQRGNQGVLFIDGLDFEKKDSCCSALNATSISASSAILSSTAVRI